MSKDVVGLVISSRAIFAAEVRNGRRGRPILKRLGVLELPPGAVIDDEVRDVNAVTKVLVQLWEQAGFTSKRVVFGVGNQRTMVRNHVVPQMTPDQLSKGLRYQVDDLLPVPIGDTILDFYPIKPVPDSTPPLMEGLLIAALKTSVENGAAAITNAGLRVAGVDLNSFAVLRSMDTGDTLSGTRLIVSIGWRVSEIIVATDGVPEFVRIVPLGAGHVLDDVRANGVELPAETGTVREFFAWIQDGDWDTDPVVVSAMVPILEQIRNTVNYYQTSVEGQPPSSVVLLGYGAVVAGAADLIAQGLNLPVIIGDPLQAFDTQQAEPQELVAELAPLLAVPLGLGMTGR